MNSILNYTISDILHILGEMPQFEGLYVYFQRKEITEIPFSSPYRTDNFTIHFITDGEAILRLNLTDYKLSAHDLIVIPPKTVIEFQSIKKKTKLITICFSMDFAMANSVTKNDISALDFFTSVRNEQISLTQYQWENFVMIASILERKNSQSSENLHRSEIISCAFKLFLYELATVFNSNETYNKKAVLSRKEELAFRFLKFLEDNFKRNRTIDFYAKNLNVSSSYLSKVIKEISGKTVGNLIDESVITEAKLLLTDPTLSITQVADELEFSDQSFFGKFFKKKTGFSPSEYRIRRRNMTI